MPTEIRVMLLTVLALVLLELRVWSLKRICPICSRRHAIFPVRGRLNRWVGVCWTDFKLHRTRKRRRRVTHSLLVGRVTAINGAPAAGMLFLDGREFEREVSSENPVCQVVNCWRDAEPGSAFCRYGEHQPFVAP